MLFLAFKRVQMDKITLLQVPTNHHINLQPYSPLFRCRCSYVDMRLVAPPFPTPDPYPNGGNALPTTKILMENPE